MDLETFVTEARAIVGEGRVRRDVPLAPLTTFNVGGPADCLVEAASAEELMALAAAAGRTGVPIAVIGGGSNVLVSDRGVRGLVLRLVMKTVRAPSTERLRVEAGCTMNGLVRWAIARGHAGLEAWAGTPGTVGGAIAGNAHFGGRNIGELVHEVQLLSIARGLVVADRAAMAFVYDGSRIQHSDEIVVWAEFRVAAGEPASLRETARRSLAHRKRTQPLASMSAGCIFQNPDPTRDRVPDGVPPSAGALVDRAGLKGQRGGGARISPLHGNFFVNEGGATATDIRRLIERARTAVHARFGVELRDEIVYLGDWSPEDALTPLAGPYNRADV